MENLKEKPNVILLLEYQHLSMAFVGHAYQGNVDHQEELQKKINEHFDELMARLEKEN